MFVVIQSVTLGGGWFKNGNFGDFSSPPSIRHPRIPKVKLVQYTFVSREVPAGEDTYPEPSAYMFFIRNFDRHLVLKVS